MQNNNIMSHYAKNLMNYNSTILQQLKDICFPLFSNLPFSHFSYLKLFNTGRVLVLSTDPKLLQMYFEYILSGNKKVFLQEFRTIPINSSYKYLWQTKQSEEINQLLGLSAFRSINVYHGISITHNSGDFTEDFIFGSSNNDAQAITNLCLNHYYLLERFMLHFKSKSRHIINCYDETELAFCQFYQEKLTTFTTKENNFAIKDKFFDDTCIDKMYLKTHDVFLSEKELECLYYVSLGESSKGIANALSISHRTVEKHLENIKYKCAVHNISELVQIGKKNNINMLHLIT